MMRIGRDTRDTGDGGRRAPGSVPSNQAPEDVGTYHRLTTTNPIGRDSRRGPPKKDQKIEAAMGR